MLNIFMYLFIPILVFHFFRIIKGPSVWDRLLGLNLFSINMIILMILYALINEINYLLDIAIVYAMLGFISIVFISRFIQRKGKI
jgi:multicomponent Na+:H+ antiporter subunit F